MTGQTNKQANKKDTIWTSFEFQMLKLPEARGPFFESDLVPFEVKLNFQHFMV